MIIRPLGISLLSSSEIPDDEWKEIKDKLEHTTEHTGSIGMVIFHVFISPKFKYRPPFIISALSMNEAIRASAWNNVGQRAQGHVSIDLLICWLSCGRMGEKK
jgi:hypothetical protein